MTRHLFTATQVDRSGPRYGLASAPVRDGSSEDTFQLRDELGRTERSPRRLGSAQVGIVVIQCRREKLPEMGDPVQNRSHADQHVVGSGQVSAYARPRPLLRGADQTRPHGVSGLRIAPRESRGT